METSGAAPPVHLERDPLRGAASSGGGMLPPKRRGIGGTTAKQRTSGEAAAAAGTASADETESEMPLSNLSNLIRGSSRPRRDVPSIKEPGTTIPAGEKNSKFRSNCTSSPRGSSLPRVRSNTYSSPRDSSLPRVTSNTSSPRDSSLPRVRSNAFSPPGSFQPRDRSKTSSSRNFSPRMDKSNSSSPRDSSALISGQLLSTSTSCSRFALLSICSHVDAYLGNTTACSGRESVISHRQKAGMRFSGGNMPQGPYSTLKAGKELRKEIIHKHRIVTSLMKGEMAHNRLVRSLNVIMPQGPSAALKDGLVFSVKIPQKHMVTRKHQDLTGSMGVSALTGFNGVVMPQKRRIKDQGPATVTELRTVRANSKSAYFPRQSSMHTSQKVKSITISQDAKESTANMNGYLTEEMIRNIQEADNLIEQLNEMGRGEDISYEEYEGYLKQLPCRSPALDTSVKPGYKELNELQVRNVIHRLKYCKFIQQMRKNNGVLNANLEDDHPLYHLTDKLETLEEDITKLEGDHLLEYLNKEGLLTQIENDGVFGWSFDFSVAGLDDYQRIAPQNYGGYEYECWDTYRRYFHSYEIELEYICFWEELLKKLKWMEDYVLIKRPSLKWGKICTRGCYQAIKIATRFPKITEGLARAAYYDCIDTLCWDIHMYKDLDAIYFETWQRITMLKESFKDALNGVYRSDKFPRRCRKFKYALQNEKWSVLEEEFNISTASITEEVTEEYARELVAYAIKNQRGKPKVYAQYIRRKMDIAKAIGVLTKQ